MANHLAVNMERNLDEERMEVHFCQNMQNIRQSTRPKRKPERFGFESATIHSVGTKPQDEAQAQPTNAPPPLQMYKQSISHILETLRKDEMEETNERELIRNKMDDIERRGKQRQRLLEHISLLLEQSTRHFPLDEDHEPEDQEEEEEEGHSSPLGGAPSLTNDFDLPEEERGAVGGADPPLGDLNDLKHYHCIDEPVRQMDTEQPKSHDEPVKAQFMSPSPHMGTSTPQPKVDSSPQPVVRPKTKHMQFHSSQVNNADSVEEDYTRFKLYDLPHSTVKKPAAPPPPARGYKLQPVPVPRRRPANPQQRLQWQYQVIRSPVHVAYSHPLPSSSVPIIAQPLPTFKQSSQHASAPPAVEPGPVMRQVLPPNQPGAPPLQWFPPAPLVRAHMANTHQVPLPNELAPATPAVALASMAPVEPSLYGAPKPTIPDFTKDSERDFANLKLALDNLLNPYVQLSEKYKFHVLLEHLKLPEAQMIAQSCRHHSEPYTSAMQALQLQYGQPHQLAQSEIAAILTSPDIKVGDSQAFQSFSLRVH